MTKNKRLSKRVSMSRRYNLAKKVREHGKKVKKQARLSKKNGILSSKKQRTDPGIPNNWPFKQQELMEIEKQAVETAKARISDKERRRMGLPLVPHKSKDTIIKDVSSLMQEANRKSDLFIKSITLSEDAIGSANVSHDEAEHTRRKFYRELKTVITQADVVIQVLDARDPESCRNKQLESEIIGSGKRLILLINKIDLVPKEAVDAWLARLRLEHPTIAFKACRNMDKFSREKNLPADEDLLNSSASVVGATSLLKLLKKYSLNNGNVGSLTAGIVGYPNVGKSSVINSLLASANKKGKSVKTGSTAGVTTQHQLISLDKKVTLVDSPGVVFSGSSDDASLVIRRAVNVSAVSDPVAVVQAVLEKIPKTQVAQQFRMADFNDADEFLSTLGKLKCKFKRGGVVDKEAAARFALHHWSNGRAKFFCMPTAVTNSEGFAQVVGQALPAFNIDDILKEADEEARAACLDEDDSMAVDA